MFGKGHLFGGGFSFSIIGMKKTDFAVSFSLLNLLR